MLFKFTSIVHLASFGIIHARLNFKVLSMRFSLQNFCIRRSEMSHFSEADFTEM